MRLDASKHWLKILLISLVLSCSVSGKKVTLGLGVGLKDKLGEGKGKIIFFSYQPSIILSYPTLNVLQLLDGGRYAI